MFIVSVRSCVLMRLIYLLFYLFAIVFRLFVLMQCNSDRLQFEVDNKFPIMSQRLFLINLSFSLSDALDVPSAILDTIETEALCICEQSPNRSLSGNSSVN